MNISAIIVALAIKGINFMQGQRWIVCIMFICTCILISLSSKINKLEESQNSLKKALEDISIELSGMKDQLRDLKSDKDLAMCKSSLTSGPFDMDHIKGKPGDLLNPVTPKVASSLDPRHRNNKEDKDE